jgi:hypothetical protein
MEKTLEQKIHDILFSSTFEEFHKNFVENAEDPHSEETFQEIQKVFGAILPETILPQASKFKIGDKVQIVGCEFLKKRLKNPEGKLEGMIVEKCGTMWTVKIPDFDGHDGWIEDGTEDKWNFLGSELKIIP